jgi:carbon monoxide dehydrogenase subunit G
MTRHAFEAGVAIRRPLVEVFGFVADPTRFPLWNSAVTSVEPTSALQGEVGSTYLMRRRLPIGETENGLEIVALERPTAVTVRTTSGPTPFTYRYRFAESSGATAVTIAGDVELGGPLAVLPGQAVRRGVDANLATLQRLLEAKKVRPRAAMTAITASRKSTPPCRNGAVGSVRWSSSS